MEQRSDAEAAMAVSATDKPRLDAQANAPAARACRDCAGPISAQSTGRCRICALRASNRDPELIARRTEGNRRHYRDPAARARHAEACRKGAMRAMEDPAERERRRRAGIEIGRFNLARGQTPEAREKARMARRRTMLAWCPEEHWAMNEELRRAGIRLEDRKRIIAELTPGTAEHARILVANTMLNQHVRAMRERMEAY